MAQKRSKENSDRTLRPLNLTNGTPKSHQVIEQITLLAQSMSPLEQLPTERFLAEHWGIARMTVRRAIDKLAESGLIFRRPGGGTYVAAQKVSHTTSFMSFSQDMVNRGLSPRSRLLDQRILAAGQELSERLEIKRGEPVIFIERLRSADKVPMAIERVHLPERFFPGLLLSHKSDESLYDRITHDYGQSLYHASQRINAVRVSDPDAKLLGIARSQPCFSVDRVTRNVTGRIVEAGVSLYRADRYDIAMDFYADPTNPPTLT